MWRNSAITMADFAVLFLKIPKKGYDAFKHLIDALPPNLHSNLSGLFGYIPKLTIRTKHDEVRPLPCPCIFVFFAKLPEWEFFGFAGI